MFIENDKIILRVYAQDHLSNVDFTLILTKYSTFGSIRRKMTDGPPKYRTSITILVSG